MEIVTRFDLGQIVWRVGRKRRVATDRCHACEGEGTFTIARLDGGTQKSFCEPCRGSGKVNKVWYDLYEVYDETRIGQVTVQLRSDAHRSYMHDPKVEESYMVEATGVGSGTVYPLRDGQWSHTQLFGSEEEALAFCATENGPILAEVEANRARLRDEVAA